MRSSNFTILQPSPDLDYDRQVKSFSIETNNVYQLNLYRMTCSCPDFHKRNRSNYKPTDIRRMCKHLMRDYYQNVGINGLTDFSKYVILNSLAIKGTLFDIHIEAKNQDVFVSYWDIEEWWDIFLKDNRGEWNCYRYVPYENDFAYGEKPIGIVGILKKELHEFYQWNRKRKKLNEREKKNEPIGCAPMIVLTLSIALTIIILTTN